jgi:3-isopropylmalate dehydrogenase
MAELKIALVPGDGIGPEVLAEGVKALRAAEKAIGGFSLNMEKYEAGAGCYQKSGVVLPEATIAACEQADAVFLGSVGMPGVVFPDGTEAGVEVNLQLRFRFDLYSNIRPIKLYPNVPSVLSDRGAGDIDYIMLRENIEGLYASRGGGSVTHDRIAVDSLVITRWETERISRVAFELSESRRGAPRDGKKRVTCVDKANVLRSYSFFRKIFTEVAEKFPAIEADYAYVDAMACWLVLQPDFYDVVVTENMFGDILTDLGAATVGGMGMSPSAEIGDKHGLFQGSHGSAPTIAGKNLANPTAAIVSGAMMLDWLGKKAKDGNLETAAGLINDAVVEVFEENKLTSDLGGNQSTSDFGSAVEAKILELSG